MDIRWYLKSSEYINWEDPEILYSAKHLASGRVSDEDTVRACFEFVRDEVRHTSDFKINQITCRASDVLKHRTGYCYAKSHLLAALLRANKIPTGLAYQRQLLDRENDLFCLHGLNAVFLGNHGWYRLDPRGNKAGIESEFTPPLENLAFDTLEDGEFYFSEIYAKPLQIVVDVLESCSTHVEVDKKLPDLPPEEICC